MSTDDFEKRVQRQPLRQIPPEWREEILQTARAASASSHAASRENRSSDFFSALGSRLSALLRLHPKSWAALAAVWIAIVAMNFYSSDKTTVRAKNTSPPTPEMILVLQNQRRELSRLLQPPDSTDVDTPKSFQPRPRGERRTEITTV
jgi:hypothetical protein